MPVKWTSRIQIEPIAWSISATFKELATDGAHAATIASIPDLTAGGNVGHAWMIS
jgi:hypothetical protein